MKTLDTVRLRAAIGWLGLLLPIIVLVLCLVFGCAPDGHLFPDSISATYYFEPTITPFMIILGAASVILMCYRGYTKWDDIINTATGICGLCICFFPCFNWSDMYVGTFQVPVEVSGWIHNISAALFFILLTVNVLFFFTKGNGTPSKKKKIRNIIYIVCGIGMALSLIGIVFLGSIYGGTWFVEAIALAFFGIAFLTKADIYPWLACDSAYEDKEDDDA